MSDDVANLVSDSPDEPLRSLAEAAREAMLRAEVRATGPQPCPAERATLVFFIDAVLGFGCLCTAAFSVNLLFDELFPPEYRASGDWIVLAVAAATPLLYSGLDVMVGGTPGKLLMGVTIVGPAPVWRARLRRWGIKGAPFILAVVLSILCALFWPEVSGSAFGGWSGSVMLLLIAAFSWWLIASAMDRKGQTLVDWMVGTRLCVRPKVKRLSGFEPVVGGAADKSAR